MNIAAAPDRSAARRARIGLSLAFWLMGAVAGIWFVHIPLVAERLALEPAALGLSLLMLGIGSLLFQPLTGMIVGRFGARRLARITHPLSIMAMGVVVQSTSLAQLGIGLFVAGAVFGATNVSLNTHATEVEAAYGRPILSSFHGFFSLGTLSAAGLGSFIIAQGWGDGSGAIIAFACFLPLTLFAGMLFLKTPQGNGKAASARERHGLAVFGAPVLILIMSMAFLGNTIEFAVNDWSALYLVDVRGLDPSQAVAGFAMFAAAMTLARFAGGPVVARMGSRRVITTGGLLVAIGMTMTVFSPVVWISILGFLITGIGAANNAPLLMSQSARLPGVPPGAGVGATATGLTSGFLLAPPLIGFVAQGFGLSVALTLMAVIGTSLVILAQILPWSAEAGAE